MDVDWIRFGIIKINENYRKTIDILLENTNSESDENSDRR